ncbi:helix-turn-helix domain-containing protein [Thalassospira sp.]|uniref:helix-turn-helix domain-containing protein n=1 Tax=Thalassospira sp. TaxID=1912094 RepID=UPI002733FB73|nr:helix-turn-helix domain-containing protein [Thalassospira sp.]MDP2699887.1 helix-turn-helix domain-containing protein [Thalassospira sp.]
MTTTESIGSIPNAAPVPRGLADRTDSYPELLSLADSFTGTTEVTTASVVGLVSRAVSQLSPCMTDLSVRLLIILIEHVYDERAWRTGRLTVWPGNRRLAEMTGKNERSVRRALCQLEANHWIVRRYSCTNRRADGGAGIDLRPVAARLHDLRQAEIFLEQKIEATREQARAERDDLARLAEQQAREQGSANEHKESGEADSSVHRKSYKLNPGSTNLVQSGASQATPGQRSINRVTGPVSGIDVDSEILFLMVQASPTLQKQLSAAELCDLVGPEPSSASIEAVVSAVRWIITHQVKLRPAVWRVGVEKHGWAALAAVVVAADRQGVRDPAGYLYSMLKAARLRDTVRHSLRALEQQESGHA